MRLPTNEAEFAGRQWVSLIILSIIKAVVAYDGLEQPQGCVDKPGWGGEQAGAPPRPSGAILLDIPKKTG
ncbi:MAG: hypothetical protein C4516_02235 [Oxalobacter sp.]|nr:MAG: hypothetical protein C4516_02235 [Oxalobacter sp.]